MRASTSVSGMEIPSAGESKDHLGTHKQPDALVFPPDKQALEASKADFPIEMIASKVDFSQEKQEKQASHYPLVDTLPEKQDKQVLEHPEHPILPGKHDSTPNLLSEEHASAQASEMQGIELPPEKQAPALGVVEFSMEKQALEQTSTEPMLLPEKARGVRLAASNGYQPFSAKVARAEIDTAAPFESVKEAVTLFGERMDWKPQLEILDHERKTAPGFDVQKVHEEAVYCQKLLSEEEASIAEILLELEKTKEQIQLCKGKVPGNDGAFPPLNQPEEVLNAKELYVNVLHELEMARKEVEGVNEQRALLESSKQSALKECEAALSACDDASMRISQLMTEQASSQEALAAAKVALAETESEIDALRLDSSVALEGKPRSELVQVSNMKLETLKSLELNLSEAGTLIEKLKEELATIRDVKVKAPSSISNSEGELMRVNLKLEQAKAVEGDRVAAIGRVLEELDVAKTNLSQATQDGASLASAVGGLQAEVAKRQVELESAHETEQIACATLASLQDELCSVRALVLSSHAGETKAREAKRTFPTEIKQLASEADEAKAASKLAQKEARKGMLELEQAKAAMSTAVSRLQAAQKEAEAARASEAMAIAEFKALSESEGDLVDSKEGSGGKVAVNISLEEYQALNDARHEAEEVANNKVAAILVQVEAAKASQKDAQTKLDVVMKELEALQKAMEEAEKKADDAQIAKLSVEAELRKWRAEHEQWRKTGSNPSSVSTSAAQSPRRNAKLSSQGKVVPHSSFQGKTAIGLDSLAEVLTLKVPAAEKAIRNLPEVDGLKKPEVDGLKKPEKAKKVSFFSRVMSIIVRKKSKPVK